MSEVQLREHFEQRLKDYERFVDERFNTINCTLKDLKEDRKYRWAMWISLTSLAVTILTLVAVLPK